MSAELRLVSKESPVVFFLSRQRGIEYLRQTVKRVESFCRKFDTDNDPETLGKAVLNDIAMDGGQFLVTLAVQGNVIKGHLLASVVMAPWGTKRRIQILQMEYDGDFTMPIAVSRQVFSAIKKWGDDNDIHRVATCAINDKIGRRLRIFYGFRDDLQQLVLDF